MSFRKRAATAPTLDPFDDDPSSVPASAVTTTRPKPGPSLIPYGPERARRERRRRWIMGLVGFAAVSGPLSLMMTSSKNNRPTAPVVAVANPIAEAVAEQVAYDWAYGRPTSMPVADGIPVDLGSDGRALPGFQSLSEVGTVDTSGALASNIEVHRFMIIAAQPVELHVPVRISSDGARAELADIPTVVPLTVTGVPAGESSVILPFLPERTLPEKVRAAISKWAEAYGADDTTGIYQATGDTDPNRTYTGLGGMTPGRITPVASNTITEGQRVVWRVHIEWVPTSSNSATTQAGVAPSVPAGARTATYDLLVDDLSAGLPHVTDWGAAGSSLDPYGHAATSAIGTDATVRAASTTEATDAPATTTTRPPATTLPATTVAATVAPTSTIAPVTEAPTTVVAG